MNPHQVTALMEALADQLRTLHQTISDYGYRLKELTQRNQDLRNEIAALKAELAKLKEGKS